MNSESAPMEQRLRILRVVSDLYPEVSGGLGIHAHSMSKRQVAMGHDVTVLTSDHGDSSLPRKEQRDGYTLIRLRELAAPLDNSIIPGVVPALWQRAKEADVVHAHSHLFFSTNLAAAFSRWADTPLILTNHGLISQTAPRWLQAAFIPTVAKFTLNSADRVLCYTDTDRDRLRNRDIDSEVAIVSNGIDCDRFTPVEANPDGDQLLFVGRLKKGKGVRYLIDAFEQLSTEYTELRLKIVGDGPRREMLEEQCIDYDIKDQVTFTGNLSYEEIPEQYNESTVFVLPSLSEGLPRTVLEALACETPVVTTALPQLKPVVNGSGYTVPKGDIEEFVDAIDRLLSDESLRSEMGKTGRQSVLEQYSWTKTVESTTNVYYGVLEEAEDSMSR